MNVGLHHRGIHAQLFAILQAELYGGLDHGLVDGLHGGRGEAVKGPVEGVVLRHAMAVEVGKAAQGKAVVNAFAQLAIIPVFDAHQDEGAQGLRGSDATASGVGVLQAARQILAHLLDQRGMVVQEPGDALQDRVEVDALVAQFEIGEAELGCGDTGHAFFSGRNSRWFNSQMRSKAALSLR
jgi:hypothetical protein